MGKILVTGANGFIGSHLVEYLLENDDRPVVGMVLEGTDESNLDAARENPRFQVVYTDILKPETLEGVFDGVEIIYHLAAIVTDWAPARLYFEVIYQGTVNVVEAAIKQGVKRLVYMSSLVVHGLKGHVDADESTPFDPVPFFPYARAKAKAEEYLVKVNETTSLETVRVRPGFDIIGPRNVTSLYKVLESIEKGKFGFINGGKKKYSLVFVKNLVAGMAHVGDLPGAAGEAYIIADKTMTWKEYVEALATRLGAPVPRLDVPYWLVAGPVWIMDGLARLFRAKNPPVLTRYRIAIPRNDIDFSSRKIRATGFVPPYSFEEGLDITISWYIKEKARRSGDKNR